MDEIVGVILGVPVICLDPPHSNQGVSLVICWDPTYAYY